MKRIAGIIAIIGLLLNSLQAQDQYDEKAKKVLDKMSNKYQKINAFKAGFTYHIKSPMGGVEDSREGTIGVEGRKYRIDLPTKEVITNGKTQWTYMKDANEVNISNYEPSDDEITPVNIHKIYKEGYKYTYLRDESENGVNYAVIDLVPEDKDEQQIFKIRIKINTNEYSIKSWKIFEKNGNRYTFEIENVTNGVDFKENYFRFNKSEYDGVEVVDLR